MLRLRIAVAAVAVLGILAAGCSTLRVVTVSAPDINCVFDTDCKITVTDSTGAIPVPVAVPDGVLQSRTFPPGEPGTAGQSLFAYDYRVDLTPSAGIGAQICVTTLKVPFGPIKRLDYDHDGKPDDVYVVTAGGLGSIAPSSATQSGGTITFNFPPGLCPGNAPGNGVTSYFFGVASANAAGPTTATVGFSDGTSAGVDARSPH